MLLFRLTLLLSLICYLAAYPVEVPVKPAGQENRVALDPADYPDLTNGLSDAEVESTLNGLSLEDLNALNKLLDDANNGPVELEASLRGHHRQAKKQHYEEMENTDDEQSVNDNCHDEDDLDKERDPCTMRPKCNKQPTCPTTKRCTSTRRCFTSSCKSLDGLLNINFDGERSNKKYRKLNAKPQEECDPEDVLCIQRNRDKAKQRPNMQDFSDLSRDQDQGNNIDSLEKLAAEAHQDQSLELHKDLDGWQSKDEPSADIFNLDPYKVPNVDNNGNANDLKESPKLTGLIAEDEGQPAQSEEEAKPGEVESSYERHQLARVAHEDHLKADEEQQPEEIEDNRQLNAAPALSQERYNDDLEVEAGEPHGNLAANEGNEGDSFIAQNAQEPMRYVIQTDDGLIQSENEQGQHKLLTDKQHSEMLNFATYQLAKEANPQLEFKRFKRDNKKTDDAPENSNESYLKKLMDSFPRDQVSQSNLNIAIREAKRAHLRVKRC